MIIKKIVLCFLSFLGLSSPLIALAENYNNPVTKIEFQDEIAGLRQVKISNFEEETPGLGVSVGYNGEKDKLTVYIYNLGLSNIADNQDDELIKEHFKQTFSDVLKLHPAANIKNITNSNSQATARWYIASFEYEENSVEVNSYLLLTTYKNNFLKFRYTFPLADEGSGKEILKDILKYFIPQISK
jgi:hypothetical protein